MMDNSGGNESEGYQSNEEASEHTDYNETFLEEFSGNALVEAVARALGCRKKLAHLGMVEFRQKFVSSENRITFIDFEENADLVAIAIAFNRNVRVEMNMLQTKVIGYIPALSTTATISLIFDGTKYSAIEDINASAVVGILNSSNQQTGPPGEPNQGGNAENQQTDPPGKLIQVANNKRLSGTNYLFEFRKSDGDKITAKDLGNHLKTRWSTIGVPVASAYAYENDQSKHWIYTCLGDRNENRTPESVGFKYKDCTPILWTFCPREVPIYARLLYGDPNAVHKGKKRKECDEVL